MTFKKILSLVICFAMLICLVACGDSDSSSSSSSSSSSKVNSSASNSGNKDESSGDKNNGDTNNDNANNGGTNNDDNNNAGTNNGNGEAGGNDDANGENGDNGETGENGGNSGENGGETSGENGSGSGIGGIGDILGEGEFTNNTSVANEYLQRALNVMASAKCIVQDSQTRYLKGELYDGPTTTTMIIDGKNFASVVDEYGTELIFVDDTLYYSMPLMGIKKKLLNATEKGYQTSGALGINGSNTGAAAYSNCAYRENADGTITLVLSDSSAAFDELVGDLTGGAFTAQEMVQVVVIDKNYRVLSISKFDSSESPVGNMAIKTETKFTYDDSISIQAPEDADEYTEVSSLMELYF